MTWWRPRERASNGRCYSTVFRSAGVVHPLRSPRPWCFSPPTTTATSRERNCLWMAASHRCRPFRAEGTASTMLPPLRTSLCQQPGTDRNACSERKGLVMRQLQLIAFGEPSEVIELHTVSEPVLGQEDVLVSMEAAPLNP